MTVINFMYVFGHHFRRNNKQKQEKKQINSNTFLSLSLFYYNSFMWLLNFIIYV